MYERMRVYVYVYAYVCMHACVHACMYVCVHACMDLCMYVFMPVCLYVCTYVHLYLYIHVCVGAWIHKFLINGVCFPYIRTPQNRLCVELRHRVSARHPDSGFRKFSVVLEGWG